VTLHAEVDVAEVDPHNCFVECSKAGGLIPHVLFFPKAILGNFTYYHPCPFYKFVPIEKLEFFRYRKAG